MPAKGAVNRLLLAYGLARRRDREAVDRLGLGVDRRDDRPAAARERAEADARLVVHARRVVLGGERVDLVPEPEALLGAPPRGLTEGEDGDGALRSVEDDGGADRAIGVDEEPGAQAAPGAVRVARAPRELDGLGRVAEPHAREADAADEDAAARKGAVRPGRARECELGNHEGEEESRDLHVWRRAERAR